MCFEGSAENSKKKKNSTEKLDSDGYGFHHQLLSKFDPILRIIIKI